MQLASAYESVSAVVALSADHANALRIRIASEHELRNRGASVLHEGERRHSEALAADAIDLAHFGGADDLHACDAICSSCRSCPGSPMAIR